MSAQAESHVSALQALTKNGKSWQGMRRCTPWHLSHLGMQQGYILCLFTLVAAMACRDAEVLSLFAAIINKLKERMVNEVPKIFEAVFQVTLQMITKNFEVSCLVTVYQLP